MTISENRMIKKIKINNLLPISAIILLIISIPFFLWYKSMNVKEERIEYRRNNDLVTIKEGYQGNPLKNGRFIDDVDKTRLSFFSLLKWKLSINPQKKEKASDPFRLNVIKNNKIFDMKDDMIVWLGHSSFLIRIDGKTFLIDPILSDMPLQKRLCDIPVRITDIKNIDYLLISHTHYDHLDAKVIKAPGLKNTKALIPLGMGGIIKCMNKDIKTEEAGWYQKYNTGEKSPRVFLMPAIHWSRRSITDTNKVLWGSFIIKGKSRCIYFAGDSAYNGYFKDIQRLFPDIDICLMPIGAYKPPYIMQKNHLSPSEAVSAFNDLKGKILIPMHYGTYDLSDEPPGEPVRFIKELDAQGQIKGELRLPDVGEIFHL
jgi:L-ascorbate metabolism protein UlaG (beta-lactamase superfamily)